MGQIARPTPQSPRPHLHVPAPALHPRPRHRCHRRRAPAPRPGLLVGRGVPVLPSQKGSHRGGLGSLPEPSPPHRQLPKAETPVPLGVHHGDWPGERGLAGRDGTGAGQGWGGESQTATGASPAPGPGSLSCLLERAQTWQDTHSSRAPRPPTVRGRGFASVGGSPPTPAREASRRNGLPGEAPPTYSAPSKHRSPSLGPKGTKRNECSWQCCRPQSHRGPLRSARTEREIRGAGPWGPRSGPSTGVPRARPSPPPSGGP